MALWLGLLSDQLGCTPRQAYEEWQSWPAGFLEDVIEARAYASAKRSVEQTTDKKTLKRLTASSPLAAMAQEIELELVAEARHVR